MERLTRRSVLAGLGAISALPFLAACQPQVVEKIVEKPVEKVVTQVVERVVEKPIERVVTDHREGGRGRAGGDRDAGGQAVR